MAESFSPVTPSSPGAAGAVSPSNPFFATFWANEAALNFQTENALAEDQRDTRNANSSYEYNQGINQRAEPLKLTANRNAANTQGLAESGVLAKTQGVTQTQYAQKGQRLSETRRNAVEKYQDAENKAVTANALDTSKYVAAAQAEGLKALEENPPPREPVVASTNPTVASNAGSVRTNVGTPGPGGVVPYTETGPRGTVKVGQPGPYKGSPAEREAIEIKQGYRKAAAKKAVAVG
jgi:hypothetical protein